MPSPKTRTSKASGRLPGGRPKTQDAKVSDLEKRLAETLGQLQTRDRELVEALDRETATAEILRVISSSPTDVQPVFDETKEALDRADGNCRDPSCNFQFAHRRPAGE